MAAARASTSRAAPSTAPYYRCTFPAEYAIANKIDHPRNVYLREDAILDRVDGWLATSFSPARITQTVETMVAARETSEVEPRAQAARAKASEAATKMARCRAALEAGGDPKRSTSGSPRSRPNACRPKPYYGDGRDDHR